MSVTEVIDFAIELPLQIDQPVGQPSPVPLVHRCDWFRMQSGFDFHRCLLILS